MENQIRTLETENYKVMPCKHRENEYSITINMNPKKIRITTSASERLIDISLFNLSLEMIYELSNTLYNTARNIELNKFEQIK